MLFETKILPIRTNNLVDVKITEPLPIVLAYLQNRYIKTSAELIQTGENMFSYEERL